MSLIQIISESRKDTFTSKFSNKFTTEQLESIVQSSEKIPGQNKYLMFMGNTINPKNFKDDLSIVTKLLERFSSVGSNLSLKDINQYKNIAELRNALNEYDNRVRREIKTVDDADVVYEDDNLTVVMPKTYKASCQFGAGTKWCTTSSDNYFRRYNEESKLFYFIDKKRPTSDPLYKVALLQKFDGDRTYFNAKDEAFTTGWIFGSETLEKILSRINTYIRTTFPEELKIWNDKEAAEQERKRLRAQEEARRRAERLEGIQQRREEGHFDLAQYPNDSDTIRANALFQHLVTIGELDIMSDEDKEELQRMQTNLEELNARYENGEEDLVDVISDLEQEIQDFQSNYQDIYDLVPEGWTHYGLQVFSFDGAEYAVGSEREMDVAAWDYVDNLIDEIGIEGFNAGFVSNYVNDSEVEDYIRDFFESDVYDNPEVYLSDEDRKLSGQQEQEIEDLRREEKELEAQRDAFETQKEALDTGDENWEEQYDAFNDKISEIEDRLLEIPDEIEEIENNPDGDYDTSKLDDIVEDRVSWYSDNPERFVSEYIGEDYSTWVINNDFVDRREFIQGVIDSDGWGTLLNPYDGTYEEETVNNRSYYIVRVN